MCNFVQNFVEFWLRMPKLAENSKVRPYPAAHARDVDDFLIIANNRGKCQQHLQVLLDLCDEIGVPTAPDKTTLPATNIIFLGIELDTSLSVARLPTVKLFEYSQLLAEVSQQRKIRKSELDSLVGKLNFASSVIPAKPYLRRLINLGIGVKKTILFCSTYQTHKGRYGHMASIPGTI